VSDDWLAALRQLHDADKARLQTQAEQQEAVAQKEQARIEGARELLRSLKAHELMREAQKALLDGQGTLSLQNNTKKYDLVLILAWQGSVSNARRPTVKDPEPIYYISIGVRDGQVLVNDQKVTTPTPATIQKAILAVAQNPGVQTREQRHTKA
jgi:hypothetical protein